MSTDATAPDFTVVMRGYDRSEVDDHLARTATTVAELRARITTLEQQLDDQRAAAAAASAAAPAPVADREVPPSERFSALGEETTRILVAAEESAREMREKATKQSEAEIAAAERAARERVDTASEHATRIVAEAEHRRNQLVRDMAELRADAEAELDRLRGVRGDLVGALRDAVATATGAVADLVPDQPTATTSGAGPDDVRPDPTGTPQDAPDPAPTPTSSTAEVTEASAGTRDQGRATATPPADGPDAGTGTHTDAVAEQTHEDVTDDRATTDVGAATPSVVVVDATRRDDAPRDDAAEGDAQREGADDADARGRTDDPRPVADGAGGGPPDDAAHADSVSPGSTAQPAAAAATAPPGRAPERHGAAPDALRSALADATVAADVGDSGVVAGDVSPALRREQSLAAVRPGALRRLRRGLQDLQNGVLQRLRERGDGDVADTLPTDDAIRLLSDMAQPFLDTAYRSGVGDAAVLAGGDVPATAAVDGGTVLGASDRVANELVEVLRTTLLPSLRAGADAGEPDASLSERVGEVFRDLKGPVVETVADRQLTRTYGTAALARWRDDGVSQIVWLLGEESRCPEGLCRSNAAEGPVSVGAEFPSGHALPPVHDGCTCALAPAPPG